jgi:hypothetical protein
MQANDWLQGRHALITGGMKMGSSRGADSGSAAGDQRMAPLKPVVRLHFVPLSGEHWPMASGVARRRKQETRR